MSYETQTCYIVSHYTAKGKEVVGVFPSVGMVQDRLEELEARQCRAEVRELGVYAFGADGTPEATLNIQFHAEYSIERTTYYLSRNTAPEGERA